MEVGRVYLKIVLILLCTSLCHSLNMNIALLQFCSLPLLSILRLPLHVTLFSSFTALALGSFPGCSLEPSFCSFLPSVSKNGCPAGAHGDHFSSLCCLEIPHSNSGRLSLGNIRMVRMKIFFFNRALQNANSRSYFSFFLWQLLLLFIKLSKKCLNSKVSLTMGA